MIEVSLTKDEAKISCTDYKADFETMQEIAENYDQLFNFDEIVKCLKNIAGATGFYFHVNNFEELLLQLWSDNFGLMLPHFKDLDEETYYNHLRNIRIARNNNSVPLYA